MTHGGKRRRHADKSLSPEAIRIVRILRHYEVSYKVIAKIYPLSRDTLYRAAKGVRSYSDTREIGVQA